MACVANVLRSSNLHSISCALHSFFQRYLVNITFVCYKCGPDDEQVFRAAVTEWLAASVEMFGCPPTGHPGVSPVALIHTTGTFPKAP